MGTVNVTLGDGEKLNLVLGQQLENAVTAVVFNFSAWKTEFGSGTLGLSVQRHGDDQPYAVVPTVSGNNATWNISELDTAYKGVGEVQVTYTVGSVVKKSTVYKFTVYRSLGENGEYPSPGQTWQEEIEDELADVKQDLAELEGGGVPTNVRQAVETILKAAVFDNTGLTDEFAIISSWASAVTDITLNQSSISISGATTSQLIATTTPTGGSVAWSSSDPSVATVSSSGLVTGVSNGTTTITATSGEVSATCSVTVSGISTLSSISAVYTQGGTVYDTDSLDSLKTDLVVTAHYSDTTTATISSDDYTLSGTLTVGTSTITVTYGGKTDTFTVTVSSSVNYLYNWDFTTSLVDSVNGQEAKLLNGNNGTAPTRDSSGVHFTAASQLLILFDNQTITGGLTNKSVEIDIAEFDAQVTNQHLRLFMHSDVVTTGTGGLLYRNGSGYNYWSAYLAGSWSDPYSASLTNKNAFSGKTVKLSYDSNGKPTLYVDGELIGTATTQHGSGASLYKYMIIGGTRSGASYCYNMTITGVRIYENE